MTSLSGLYVYPVKSARGIALREALLGDRGIEHDRRFMVVDDGGHMLTQRVLGALARLAVAIEGDALALSFEGVEHAVPLCPRGGTARRVRVFSDEVDALDLGPEVRSFLSAALGRPAALVYMPDETQRRVDPTRAAEHDIVGFADGFPYLLANESSLEALNRELPMPVTMQRFRPNFVVRGLPPYGEDALRELTIGGVPFLALKPSSRCVIVNIDPQTGLREKGVFETLVRTHASERRPMFGQNLVARGRGRVALGDPVALGSAS
jgi:uncharacterized protein YcbX